MILYIFSDRGPFCNYPSAVACHVLTPQHSYKLKHAPFKARPIVVTHAKMACAIVVKVVLIVVAAVCAAHARWVRRAALPPIVPTAAYVAAQARAYVSISLSSIVYVCRCIWSFCTAGCHLGMGCRMYACRVCACTRRTGAVACESLRLD